MSINKEKAQLWGDQIKPQWVRSLTLAEKILLGGNIKSLIPMKDTLLQDIKELNVI